VADLTLLAGTAAGPAVVLDEPLSMWGGLDPLTGAIIDERHPQVGTVVTGAVLVMPVGRGSSSASSVLAEALRLGTAPAAIVLSEPDPVILVGAIVAEELYGVTCPIVVADEATYRAIETDHHLEVTPEGVARFADD
jgi:uncharacterized protein